MRGEHRRQETMFSRVSPEARLPERHPLRAIRAMVDGLVWGHSTLTKNRDRLLETDIARRVFRVWVEEARTGRMVSDEHFSVDGTLIYVWASMKCFGSKDGSGSDPGPGRNSERGFHGEQYSNAPHASQTHPQARLYGKSRGQGAQLCYQSPILMENCNGLIMDHELTEASGTGERTAAVAMVTRLPGSHRGTEGADRGLRHRRRHGLAALSGRWAR